jgi:hypothetical protein
MLQFGGWGLGLADAGVIKQFDVINQNPRRAS